MREDDYPCATAEHLLPYTESKAEAERLTRGTVCGSADSHCPPVSYVVRRYTVWVQAVREHLLGAANAGGGAVS